MKKTIILTMVIIMLLSIEKVSAQILPGKAIDVSAGYDGSVFVVGISKRVFKWNKSRNNWDLLKNTPDNVKRITVDPSTKQPWITLEDNRIYQYVNGNWKEYPGRAIDIAASTDGIYCIGISERLFKWNSNINNWNVIDKNMTDGMRVSVSPEGIAWVVFNNNKIRRWISNKWQDLPGAALDVSVSPNNKTWVVGTSQRLFEFENNKWNLKDDFDKAIALSVTAGNVPIFLDEDNTIYRGFSGANRTGAGNNKVSRLSVNIGRNMEDNVRKDCVMIKARPYNQEQLRNIRNHPAYKLNSNNADALERKGPANITFHLSNQISSDHDFGNHDVLSIFNTIYRDANLQSGYFYFLPAAYNLSWIENTGEYEFSASYSAATGNGRGETTVTAILTPKLTRKDIELAKDLLQKNLQGKLESKFGITELISVPMTQSPEILFTNLGQFDVQPEDISIRAPSDLTQSIYISFTTERIDDLMNMFFNNIGLYGDVIVHPHGEDMPETVSIPFNLKIDDPKTYGNFELTNKQWRDQGWQNKTDYPLVLSNLHVLRKESNRYKVYSWAMGGIEVPEQAKAHFNAALVPEWVDNDPNTIKIWMDYSVKPCASCNQAVKDKIIQGTSHSRVNDLEFTILTPLSYCGADLMKIKVRSYQADPNGMSQVYLPTLTVTSDGEILQGGQLFIPDGEYPDFEYLLQVYMPDGTFYEASQWQKASELDVVIGSKQLTDIIPELKQQ